MRFFPINIEADIHVHLVDSGEVKRLETKLDKIIAAITDNVALAKAAADLKASDDKLKAAVDAAQPK